MQRHKRRIRVSTTGDKKSFVNDTEVKNLWFSALAYASDMDTHGRKETTELQKISSSAR